MTDLLDQVRDANCVPRNAWSTTAEGQATRERAFAGTTETVPRSRRRRPALVAALMVLVLVAAIAVVSTDRGSDPPPIGRTPTLKELTTGTWSRLPGPDLDLTAPTAVWTGKRLILWSNQSGAGSALDPRTGRWRDLPPNPSLSTGPPPVWSGTEMIVWSGSAESDGDDGFVDPAPGAAFDPSTRSWRAIAPAPVHTTSLPPVAQAIWTGTELVVTGAVTNCPVTADCATAPILTAAYTPSTDTWRLVPLPASPALAREFFLASFAWDGDRVVGLNLSGRAVALDLASSAWTALADAPTRIYPLLAVPMASSTLWIGHGASDADGWHALRLARNAATWSTAAPPRPGRSLGPSAAAPIGRRVAVLSAPDPSAILDVDRGVWREMPSPPKWLSTVHWTGTELVGMTGDGKLFRYTPGP